ncbi:ricin-type beta-trefoil lectin domain protein [Actinocorallia populi]|uniref:ricin-type beta-trefoil lectin domain protein n=1 Tax=Actinocorallia populi TaxID=2079200 RepID=UPI00130039D2|nr:ricin-type beta-trefoil lectin domain protein [Actinocorallia populi]
MSSRWVKRGAAVGLAAAALVGAGASPAAADAFSIVNDLRDECLDAMGESTPTITYAQVVFCDQGQGQYWEHYCGATGSCDRMFLVNLRMNRQMYCLEATANADGARVHAPNCNSITSLSVWSKHPIPDSADAVKYVLDETKSEARWKCLGRRGTDVVLEYCSTAGTQLWRYR